MADKKVKIGVGFNVDKSGLNELKRSLNDIINMKPADLVNTGNIKKAEADLKDAQSAAVLLQGALEKSFNTKLGTSNIATFTKTIEKSGFSITEIQQKLYKAGTAGKTAFRNITTELLTTNKYVKQTSQWVDKMATTLSNTVRWSIASTAINNVTGSIQKAYSFTKSLDSSLNDIRIVTEKSADEMERFAVQANKAAKQLGASTKAYSDASLIYYQQGLSDRDVAARADVTTKVSNITKQSTGAVSEQLTAVWNGYKVSAQEAELYIDKLSAVAASTAADLEELSTGMSKVASAANIMGVDIDQLNAQLATIVSITREAPESIGTALKTVYARMSDIQAGLDEETTLDEYTEQMAKMGVHVLNAQGQLRDMGDVVEEIGGNWNNLTRAQQVSLAQTIAGTRQYSRMMALFDNWNMYQQAKGTSQGAAGTLQKQQDIYMESTEAHLAKLSAEAEDLYMTLLDPKGINTLVDLLKDVVSLADNFAESIGGGAGILRNFGAIALNVFNKQITGGIVRAGENIKGFFDSFDQEKGRDRLIKDLSAATGIDVEKFSTEDEGLKEIIDLKEKSLALENLMTKDEKEQLDLLIKQKAQLYEQQDAQKQALAKFEAFKKVSGENNNLNAINELRSYIGDQDLGLSSFFREYLNAEEEVEKYKNRPRATQEQKEKAAKNLQDKAEEFNTDDGIKQQLSEYQLQIEKIQELTENGIIKLSEEEIKRLEEAKKHLGEIGKIVDSDFEFNNDIQLSSEQIKALSNDTEVVGTIAKKSGKKLDELANSAENLGEKMETTAKEIKKAKDASNGFIKSFDLDKIVSSATAIAGKITNIVAGIQTLINLPSIWSDEELTGGEKFLQTLTNIGMVLPMLIQGFSLLKPTSLIKGFGAIGSAVSAKAAAATAGTAKGAGILGTGISGAAAGAGALTIGGVLLGAAAIAGITYAIVKAYNKEKDALKAATKAREEANKALNDAQSAYQEVTQSLDNYKNAHDAFDELTKGTQEWTDALMEANNATLELIKNYEWLAQYLITDPETGAMSISEEGLAALKRSQQNEVLSAQNDVIRSNRNVRDRQIEYDKVILSRGKGLYDDVTEKILNSEGNTLSEKLDKYFENRTEEDKIKLKAEWLPGLEKIVQQQETSARQFIEEEKQIQANNIKILGYTENVEAIASILTYTGQNASNKTIKETKDLISDATKDLKDGALKVFNSITASAEVIDDDIFKTLDKEAYTFIKNLSDTSTELQGLPEEIKNAFIKSKEQLDIQTENFFKEDNFYGGNGLNLLNTVFGMSGSADDLFSNIDIATANKARTLFNRAHISSGTSGQDTIAKGIASLGGLEIFDNPNLDVNSKTFYTDFIQEYGESLDMGTKEAKNFLFALKGTSQQIGLTAEDIKELNGIIESLGEIGDTISRDEFLRLQEEYGAQLDEYFIKTADGSYMLATSLEALEKGVRNANKEVAKANLDDAITKYDDAQTITKRTFNTENRLSSVDKAQQENYNAITSDQSSTLTFGYEYDKEGVDYGPRTDTYNIQGLKTNAVAELKGKVGSRNDERSTARFLYEYANINTAFGQAVKDYFGVDDLEDLTEKQWTSFNWLSSSGDILFKEDFLDKLKSTEGGITSINEVLSQYSNVDKGIVQVDVQKVANEILDSKGLLNDPSATAEYKDYYKADDIAQWIRDLQQANILSAENASKFTGLLENSSDEALDGLLWKDGSNNIVKQINSVLETDGGEESLKAIYTGVEGYIKANNITATGEDLAEILQDAGYDRISYEDGKFFFGEHEFEKDFTDATEAAKASLFQQASSNLEKFKATFEDTLDSGLDELKRRFIEFQKSIIDDNDFLGIGGAIKNSFDIANDNIGVLQSALQNLEDLEKAGLITDDTAEDFNVKDAKLPEGGMLKTEADAYRLELINKLMDEGLALQEAATAYEENILNYQEAVNQAYEDYIGLLESADSILEHQASMYELMYGEDAYRYMSDYYTSLRTNAKVISELRKEQYEQDKLDLQKALDSGDDELIADAREKFLASEEAYMSSLVDVAQKYRDEYQNTVANSIAAFEEGISGGKSFSKLREQYEWINSLSEDYLNDIDAAFGLADIEHRFNKAITSATDLTAQKKLNAAREEELRILRDKDKLTQYDLDRAKKRLEITQAEIDLQNAQQSKTQMRLVRGADGSYSYQYVADQNEIEEKEANLRKLQQDLVQMDEDAAKDSVDRVWDLYQEMIEKMKEASSEEEAQEIFNMYADSITSAAGLAMDQVEFLKKSMGGAGDLLGEDFTNAFPWMSTDFFNEIIKGIDESGTEGFRGMFSSTMNEIIAANQEMNNGIEAANSALTTAINEHTSAITGATTNLEENLKELTSDEMKGSINDFISTLTTLNDAVKLVAETISTTVKNEINKQADVAKNYTVEFTYAGENSSQITGWTIKEVTSQVASANTGGYTGEWGNEGKFLLAHEKELILNKVDTANILSAVDMVRALTTSLDSSMWMNLINSSFAAMETYSRFLDKLGGGEQSIDQNVHITAEFPNVEDREEIVEAFNDLVNIAAQHAFKDPNR